MKSSAVPFLLLVALLLPGCAVGEEPPAPSSGTGLDPRLKPEKKKDRRPSQVRESGKGRADSQNDGRKRGVTPSGKKTEGGSDRDASPTKTTPTTAPPAPAPDRPQQASVTDRSGDARGLGVPSYADLTGAVLRRDAGRYALRVSAAAAYPRSTDKVLHVICFADVDGDGSIDYELWGTLADNGWNGTWRHPDGAKFGAGSGISVRGSGNELTFSFAADRLGGADRFRWLVGAEFGTLEQQATGTMSEDYAPDNGAVRFPG